MSSGAGQICQGMRAGIPLAPEMVAFPPTCLSAPPCLFMPREPHQSLSYSPLLYRCPPSKRSWGEGGKKGGDVLSRRSWPLRTVTSGVQSQEGLTTWEMVNSPPSEVPKLRPDEHLKRKSARGSGPGLGCPGRSLFNPEFLKICVCPVMCTRVCVCVCVCEHWHAPPTLHPYTHTHPAGLGTSVHP